MRRIATLVLVGAGLTLLAVPVEAQRFSRTRIATRAAGLPDIPGNFTFCRLAYTSVRRDGSGGGWDTDAPEAERNLLTRVAELTRIRPSRWTDGEPGYTTVRATDPHLFECPFIMATDVGELGFRADESEALRDYFAKGGFWWADDFWGSAGWRHFTGELQRLLPDHRLVELTPEHPLLSTLYVVPEILQIPSIQSWRRSGATSELGADSATPSMWAMVDQDDRIVILVTHNTDVSDGWEREAYDDRYFIDFSPHAYAIAFNVLLWAMMR